MDSRRAVTFQDVASESSSKPKKPRRRLINLTPHIKPTSPADEDVPLKREECYIWRGGTVGPDPRFWSFFHVDWYTSAYKAKQTRVVPMEWIDWKFTENRNNVVLK
jgi:hypothetical protein